MNKREKEIIEFALTLTEMLQDGDDWDDFLRLVQVHNGKVELSFDEWVDVPDIFETQQVCQYIMSHPTRRRGCDDHRVGYSSLTEMLTAFGEYCQT